MSSVDDVVERPPIIDKDAIDSSNVFLATQLEKTSGFEAANAVAILLSPSRRPDAEKELLRRLDLRLLPTLFLIYILNSIDRLALTSARLKGLETDLHLTDVQYSTVLAVIYVSYTAQILSNMMINHVSRPSWYIAACVIIWGLISVLTGVTRNYPGILVVRFLIGFPASAYYPGAIYLLSRWYTRRELAFRCSVLEAGFMISNAFGSLMAAGILSRMEGKMGIRAWRWLFYIEGAITICIGFVTIWLLPDYPYNTRWLSPAQRRLAQVRLAEDAGEADEDSTNESLVHGLKLALKDPKVYIFAMMSCSMLLGVSFNNFFPTLTATLGFSTTVSLLLAAPPWLFTTIVSCTNAWHADKSGERFLHVTIPWWGVIVGYIIGLSTSSVGGRYFGMFIMASGYAGTALLLVWVSNAIPRPPSKRSASIAFVNGIGNIGSLIGSYAWKVEWGPQYHPSMIICLASLTLSISLALGMRFILVAQNKNLERDQLQHMSIEERQRIERAAVLEGLSFREALAKKKGFRYLY